MTAETVRALLEQTGIAVDGPNPWDIQVYDPRCFGRAVRDRNLGLGESYMDRWWDCRQFDEMICRLLRGRLEEKIRASA
jgi:cyclopropane-fatty-acyl-phospholipid synthase